MPFYRIDMETYKRRAHFDYFRTLAYPYTGTTVMVDATGAYEYARRSRRSFYLTLLHAAALAADAVPEMRQRIRGDGIVEYSECPTSHTELLEDETYCYCTIHHHMPLDEYYAHAEAARSACRSKGIEEDGDVESMYFISTLPWLHYTALVQPVAGGNESNPRITWGKYEKNASGSLLLPVTVLAHHALVDGIHIARFYERLDEEIRIFGSVP